MASLLAALRAGPAIHGWKAIPYLMKRGMVVSAFFGGMLAVMGLLVLLDIVRVESPKGYPLDVATSRTASLAILPLGIILLVIAYAIWTEKRWSRHVATAFWSVGGGMSFFLPPTNQTNDGEWLIYIAWGMVATGAAAWYFYLKGDVDQYFRNLWLARFGA